MPMEARWNGVTIARSEDTVVVESNHYFPASDIHDTFLKPSDHTSFCPWKGEASYCSLVVDGAVNENAAWVYREPKEAAKQITGRYAFWKGVEVVSA